MMNSITKPVGKRSKRIMIMALALIVSALFLPITAYAGGDSDDTTAPTISAWLDGENLCILAEDDIAVEAVFISGEKVAYPAEEGLTLPANDYAGEDNKLTIYAADATGNVSNTIVLDAPSETESAIPLEANPFTPSGTGTVVDNASDGDGKEFFTIMTAEEHVFYLIIDRQRDQDNVYFLNAVTIQDLVALAEQPLEGVGGTSGAIPTTSDGEQPNSGSFPDETDVTDEPIEDAPAESKSNSAMYILIAVIALGGIAAGYYIKVLKPKRDGRPDDEDEDDEDEYEIVENDRDYESEPNEPEDADFADFKDAPATENDSREDE